MSVQPELFVIVNYQAARARAAWDFVRPALAAAGIRFDAHAARQPGDAQTRARLALREGYRTIAVVGGDGTLSEVAAGFFARAAEDAAPAPVNPAAALALLPGGTGNDFARSLEGQRATLTHWLARLVAHCHRADAAPTQSDMTPHSDTTRADTTRAVDLLHGVVTTGAGARAFLCLNAVTLGIGAEVAGRVAAQAALTRRLPGEARFALAALAALARWRLRRLRIQLDDGAPEECLTNLVAVVNSRYAGGGMMFAPSARVDDGQLDLVTACGLPRAAVVRELPRIYTGGHVHNPRVRIARGTRVRIAPLTPADALPVEADGDVRGHTPVEFRLLPAALRVVI
ncbi:MAG TPA: diacylglycerol kinase family protein [Pyrinomonadaceae bacterium]|jgi:diacylglycerol kinase family enzyme